MNGVICREAFKRSWSPVDP